MGRGAPSDTLDALVLPLIVALVLWVGAPEDALPLLVVLDGRVLLVVPLSVLRDVVAVVAWPEYVLDCDVVAVLELLAYLGLAVLVGAVTVLVVVVSG